MVLLVQNVKHQECFLTNVRQEKKTFKTRTRLIFRLNYCLLGQVFVITDLRVCDEAELIISADVQ